MIRFVALLLLLAPLGCVGHRDDHLICKKVGDLFDDEGSSDSGLLPSSKGLQGIPGKRGPQGFKGEMGYMGLEGPRGPQGAPDYSLVNETIDQKIAPEISDLRTHMAFINDTVQATKQETEDELANLEERLRNATNQEILSLRSNFNELGNTLRSSLSTLQTSFNNLQSRLDDVARVQGYTAHRKVRLVNGGNLYGRVEVFYAGKWGTICDDSWDLNDANVICRQLGKGTATEAPGRAAFGQGSDPIWMDNVVCNGDEANIGLCSHFGIGSPHDCSHSEDASVRCSG